MNNIGIFDDRIDDNPATPAVASYRQY